MSDLTTPLDQLAESVCAAARIDKMDHVTTLAAECQRITERLRTLVHGADDVTADTAIDSLTVTVQRRRALAEQVREWIAANGPGGWINELRADRDRLAADVQRLTAEVTDWILVADAVKHDWRCFHGEADTPMCLRCQVERLTAENATLRARLPAEMPDCTIVFKECAKGHGWLTATNWVQHDCPTCALMNDAERAEGRMPL